MTNTMPSDLTSESLIQLTNQAWYDLVTYADGLSQAHWETLTDAAGWTVRDHIAHVTAWDLAAAELLENHVPIQRTLGVTDGAWSSGSFDVINAEIYEHQKDKSIAQVKSERDDVHTRIVAILDGFSDEDLKEKRAIAGLSKGIQPLGHDLYELFPMHYADHLRWIRNLAAGDRA